MKSRTFTPLLSVIFILSCNSPIDQADAIVNEALHNGADNSNQNVEPKVTGIGGIFFTSDNPGESKEWYQKNLGIQMDDYGAVFESKGSNSDKLQYLRWSLFNTETDYFLPSSKQFMINYRVQNIEGIVKQLKEKNVTVVDSIVSYDYGKFVHLMDPDGNKIELWEPVDSVLSKISTVTNK